MTRGPSTAMADADYKPKDETVAKVAGVFEELAGTTITAADLRSADLLERLAATGNQ